MSRDLADLQRMAPAHVQAEIDALREFFSLWEDFHAMAADKLHRARKEDLAQRMVEKAMLLRQLRGTHGPMRVNGGVPSGN